VIFCDVNSLSLNTHFFQKCHMFFGGEGGSLETTRTTIIGEGDQKWPKKDHLVCVPSVAPIAEKSRAERGTKQETSPRVI